MNKEDRKEFDELKQILRQAFKDKYDPGNGEWKTARAIFETETVGTLGSICKDLKGLKASTDKIPDLVTLVNNIQCWRKKINKVLLWVGMCVITPIILFIIYQMIRQQ